MAASKKRHEDMLKTISTCNLFDLLDCGYNPTSLFVMHSCLRQTSDPCCLVSV